MIKTEQFSALAQEFQDRRHVLTCRYEKDLKALEPFKGSGGYVTDRKTITERYKADMDALKRQYGSSLTELVDQMDKALHSRKYTAPSEDQMRLLQLIEMQADPSREDLLRTAEAVKESPAALYALNDMASKKAMENGHITMRDCLADYMADIREMPLEMAERHLTDLRSGLHDFLEYDSKPVSRSAARAYQILGREMPVARRDLFDSTEGCFQELCKMDAQTYDAFSMVVDF